MWLHPQLGRQRHAQSELGGGGEGGGEQESDVISQLADCIFHILNGLHIRNVKSRIIAWFEAALLRAVSISHDSTCFERQVAPPTLTSTLSFNEA